MESELFNSKVIIKESDVPGPNVAVFAGIHGNEFCGVKALDNLLPNLKLNKGKCYFVYCNLEAIKQDKRFVDVNLNRCFVEKQGEGIEWKTSRDLMKILDQVDVLLDIHASNSPDSIPFLIAEPHCFDIAKCLPGELLTFGWDIFEAGATDAYMNNRDKKGIGIECGYARDLESIKVAEKAIINFLTKLGLLEGEIDQEVKKVYEIVGLYHNKNNSFKKSRDFSDFEVLKERTLMGLDGEEEVYLDAGNIVIFVRDKEGINQECFILAKEV
jgi:succinylglutamate desuccinylase